MQQRAVQAQKNIVETAIEAGQFNTLVAAVKAAGLVETLSSPGPFTVFAPNDAAFAKIPKETIDHLMENPSQLAEVLKYHVISGTHMADDIVKMRSVRSLQGSDLEIDTTRGVRINGVSVIQPDIVCSNGVCHVIDSVLIPK
ncbi:fasciclin domain-containing protein [Methanofollis formosanus]|uniref:Fasciclin domain-containing protein n=1 Tax=Methanofollis formosanus TaxID=299308 RepID=A0A8G1EGW9_9EURY|nr:fasciclin domain-containing protein [Methanofollis formosanus]QYZ80235.1 fasciclin domain-containing protein [Methanofollis formosanus]